ncbi:MAG: TolC family protein [Parachlamydiales bacterium]|jgi:outer membrane protein TolC
MKRIFFALLASTLLSGCYHNPYIDDGSREFNAEFEYEELNLRTNLPLRPLSLCDIIEIALEQNLDAMVKLYEYEVQREVVTGERLKMLPSLIASVDSSDRNNNTGSFSQSLSPGIPPAPPSISATRARTLYNFYAVWNLLDFGLAYYRSAQEADKGLIIRMEYERLKQNLVLDITKQYWKAIASKHAIEKGRRLLRSAKSKAAVFVRQIQEQLIPVQKGLVAKTLLLNIERDIQKYARDYHEAIMALSQFMALPPCLTFELAEPCIEPLPCLKNIDICEYEKCALKNRPELYIGDLQEQVMVEEARIAVLQMFPSAELFAGNYNDTNSFLIYNHWIQAGLRATWNLFQIPRQLVNERGARWRQVLARHNRLAVSVGVITQVHLSHLTYMDNFKSFKIVNDLKETYATILNAAEKEQKAGRLHAADVIKFQADALFAEIDALKAYGEAQISIEQLNNALGIPGYITNQDGCPCDCEEEDEMKDVMEGYTQSEQQALPPLMQDFPSLRDMMNYKSDINLPKDTQNDNPLDTDFRLPQQTSSSVNKNESWLKSSSGEGAGSQYDPSYKLPSTNTWDVDSTERSMLEPGYVPEQNFDRSEPIRTPEGSDLQYDPDFDEFMNPSHNY